MLASFMPSSADYMRFMPEIILTIAATLIMFLEAAMKAGRKPILSWIAAGSLILGIFHALNTSEGPAFNGMLAVDGMAVFFRVLVMVAGLLVLFGSGDYLRREHADVGEYYALVLFSIVGQCIMASANELIMIFIGLEISSIASYILAGYLRDHPRNTQSPLKYLLLGSFETAFLLYGVAWIYGATGSTNLTVIR